MSNKDEININVQTGEYLLFNVKVLLQCEAIRYNIIVYHRTITLLLLWPLFNILCDTTLVYDSGWSLPAWVARQMIEPCLCINIFHYQLKSHFACIFISMQSHLFQFIDSGFVEQTTSLSAFHFFFGYTNIICKKFFCRPLSNVMKGMQRE